MFSRSVGRPRTAIGRTTPNVGATKRSERETAELRLSWGSRSAVAAQDLLFTLWVVAAHHAVEKYTHMLGVIRVEDRREV